MSRRHFLSSAYSFHRQWIRSISNHQNPSTKDVSKFNNFKNADEFIIDRNPHAKRQKFWEKEIDGSLMVCEKALPEDHQSIIDFYVTHFCSNEVLTGSLKYTPDEATELFTDIMKDTNTLILRDNDKFIGMNSLKKVYLKGLPDHGVQRLNDYGNVIDNGTFKSRKNNIIVALLESVELNIFNEMVFPCTYVDSIFGLHPTCYGKKMAEDLAKTALKYSIAEGVNYIIGVSTSDASMKVRKRMPGVKFVEKFPYASFVDHGKKPFENVIGGNKYAYPFILNLEKYKEFYD